MSDKPNKPAPKRERFNPNALHWDDDNLEPSLERLFRFTVGKAEGSIRWYDVKSRPKKRWAQMLRVTAILATALGGILPILSQMPLAEKASVLFNPAWASVAIAVAATALGLDRFFGFSSAWMRFMTTQMHIQSKLEAFQYNWMRERAAWGATPPGFEQAQAMIVNCANFAAEVSKLVEDETQAWVSEFQNVLRRLDETGKAQIAAAATGAIVANVDNGANCADGWRLTVAGKSPQHHRGESGVVSDVFPGSYKVTVSGEINGRPVQAESMVQVPPGGIVEVPLTLA